MLRTVEHRGNGYALQFLTLLVWCLLFVLYWKMSMQTGSRTKRAAAKIVPLEEALQTLAESRSWLPRYR